MSEKAIKLIDHDEWLRQQSYHQDDLAPIYQLLEAVKDPEIPALSIWDMGILRLVRLSGDQITVLITPTYSGCPAMDLILEQIHSCLSAAGFDQIAVETHLSPAWTTAWMSGDARLRMAKSGIAPPEEGKEKPDCPLCGSTKTKLISEYGSTSCKAFYTCQDCLEPFDYFKVI